MCAIKRTGKKYTGLKIILKFKMLVSFPSKKLPSLPFQDGVSSASSQGWGHAPNRSGHIDGENINVPIFWPTGPEGQTEPQLPVSMSPDSEKVIGGGHPQPLGIIARHRTHTRHLGGTERFTSYMAFHPTDGKDFFFTSFKEITKSEDHQDTSWTKCILRAVSWVETLLACLFLRSTHKHRPYRKAMAQQLMESEQIK